MGAGSSNTNKYFIDTSPELMKIDVSSKSSNITQEEKEDLRILTKGSFIKMGDLGFKERYDNTEEIIFSRWNWILNNTEKYINILRINGYSDACIQESFNGIKPLAMDTKQTFDQFCDRIFTLKDSLSKNFKIRNLKVAMIGSSLYGFSNNPFKGSKEIPTNIARSENCDFDFVFIGVGINNILKEIKEKNPDDIKHHQFIDEFKRKGIRNRIKKLEVNLNIVFEWKKEMNNFLKRKVRIYFQEGEGNLPPWESIIDKNHQGCC